MTKVMRFKLEGHEVQKVSSSYWESGTIEGYCSPEQFEAALEILRGAQRPPDNANPPQGVK